MPEPSTATGSSSGGGQPSGRRVLVTGIAGPLGAGVARRLERHEDVASVHGVAAGQPRPGLDRTEHVRAGLGEPAVERVLHAAGVDTLVHAAVGPAGDVAGTGQLLAACRRAGSVRCVVVVSSTAIYAGAETTRAVLTERDTPRTAPASGFPAEVTEIEEAARRLGRRTDAEVVVLRLANLVGPGVRSPLARLLGLAAVPTVLGYDPRLQFCHLDDAVAVLARAALEESRGVYNVAGPGAVYLSQCLRLAGRPPAPLPLPVARASAAVGSGRCRLALSREQVRRLHRDCVVDVARLREHLGYEPEYSSHEAVAATTLRHPSGTRSAAAERSH